MKNSSFILKERLVSSVSLAGCGGVSLWGRPAWWLDTNQQKKARSKYFYFFFSPFPLHKEFYQLVQLVSLKNASWKVVESALVSNWEGILGWAKPSGWVSSTAVILQSWGQRGFVWSWMRIQINLWEVLHGRALCAWQPRAEGAPQEGLKLLLRGWLLPERSDLKCSVLTKPLQAPAASLDEVAQLN